MCQGVDNPPCFCFPVACCEWWLCGRPTLMVQGGSVGAPVLPPAAAAATPSPAPASAVPPPPRARAPAAPMPGPAPAPLPVRVCPCVWCANRTSQGRPCHVPCHHALDVWSWDGMAAPWVPSLPLRPWCVYCCCSFGSSVLWCLGGMVRSGARNALFIRLGRTGVWSMSSTVQHEVHRSLLL